MVPYIFAFFAVGIFVVDTNNYKLTKSNNVQTNLPLCQGHGVKFHLQTF